MRHPIVAARPTPDAISLAVATWFASGVVLLGLTPLPLHAAALGWSPAFWLLAAPLLVLSARWLCAHQVGRSVASRPRAARARHVRSQATRARAHAAMPARLASIRRISSRTTR